MYSYFYIVVCGVVRRLSRFSSFNYQYTSKEHASYKIGVSQMSSRPMLR